MGIPFSVRFTPQHCASYLRQVVRLLICTIFFISPIQASESTTWLLHQLQTDGGVYLPGDLANAEQSTVAAISYLQQQNSVNQTELQHAHDFLQSSGDRSSMLLAGLIQLKQLLPENTSALIGELLMSQNLDGGFGAYRHYDSAVMDTALALDVLRNSIGEQDQAIWQAINFLINRQNGDGGWRDGVNESDVVVTAQVVTALTPFYTYHSQIPSALTQAESYLLSQRTSAGGRAWLDTYQTALALLALVPISSDKSIYQTSIDWLGEIQAADGSWHQDVYQTALAAQAIALFSLPITPPDLASLSGLVIDISTGLPLTGVSVHTQGETINTAADGEFFLTGLTPGEAEITVSLAGYGTLTVHTSLNAGQTTHLGELQLIPSSSSSVATLSGTVTDGGDDGQPIWDALVSIPDLGLTTLTNASGEYQITGIPEGEWQVQVEKSGYLTQYANFTATAGGNVIFSPTLLPDLGGGSSALFGRIVAADTGEPLAGVSVHAVGSTTTSALTDTDGNYLITLLSSSDWQVTASKSGYDDAQIFLQSLRRGNVEFSPMLYPVGSSPEGANTSSLSGRIQDAATKMPLVGVAIEAQWGSESQHIYTDGQGDFIVNGVSATRGNLIISHTGYRSSQIAFAIEPLENRSIGVISLLPVVAETLAPDLVIGAINADNLITDTQTGTLSGEVALQIENIGNSVSNNQIEVLAYYDVDHNTQFDSSIDITLGQSSTSESVGVSGAINLDMPISGAIPYVDAPIGFWVDHTQTIQESDESNNQRFSFAQCSAEEPPSDSSISLVEKWHWANQRILSTPLVSRLIDTNSDGVVNLEDKPVVIVVSHTGFIDGSRGILRVLDGELGQEIWSMDGTNIYTEGPAVPAVGDIDGDGFPEIVMYRFGGGVVAIDHDGGMKWESHDVPDPGRLNYGSISIADLDNDGTSEILARNYVLDHNGLLERVLPLSVWNATSAFAIDFNHDGFQEIVLGSHVYTYLGQPFWANADTTTAFSAVANFDNDEFPELVVVDPLATLIRVYDNDGSLFWSFNMSGRGGGTPTISDFDGDGFPEIGVANHNYYTAVNHDGSLLWQFPITEYASSITGSSSFDFNKDGRTEIVHADAVVFRIIDGLTGSALVEVGNLTNTAAEYPAVADIDGDTHAEVLLVADRSPIGIRAFEGDVTPWASSRAVWNQYNYHIDNVNADGSIPTHPEKSWLTHNTFRLNAFPESERPGSHDLTAGFIRAVDEGIGQGYRISARIGNAGLSNVAAGVPVHFYAGDPAAGGLLLGSVDLPRIDAGRYQVAEISGVSGLDAATELFVVVDQDNQIDECREENNQASAPFAANVLGALSTSLDASVYAPDSLLTLDASVRNLSQLSADFVVRHRIEDSNQDLLLQFADQPVTALASDQSASWQLSWDTALTMAGSYRLVSELFDDQGELLAQTENLFVVQHPSTATPEASLRTTTDRPVYHTTDTLYVDHLVMNETVSTLLQQLQIVTLVLDGNGQLVASASHGAADLTPGSLQRTIVPLTVTDRLPGPYTVVGELLYQGAAQPVMSVAQIQIEQDLAVDMVTATSVDLKLIENAEPQVCRSQIDNQGGLAVNGLSVRHSLIHFDRGDRVSGTTSSIDLMAGASHSLITNFSSASLSAGHYACALEIQRAGDWQQFGYDAFEVSVPPINLESSLSQQGLGRVLVLVDGVGATESCYAPTQIRLELRLAQALSPDTELHLILKDKQGLILDSELWSASNTTWPLDTVSSSGHASLQVNDLQAERLSLSISAATAETLQGDYQIALQITDVGGELQHYDSQLFTLGCVQPYVMGQSLGDFTVSAVVLPASVTATGDPHGPAAAPGLTAQRLYLESTLQQAGWSYQLTDNAEDFVRELRHGGYHLALVLSEQIKLEAQTQKELREMVFRGEGLVLAGSHDNRNKILFDILGIKLNGKAPDAEGVVIMPPVVHAPVETALAYSDKVLRNDLLEATQAGHYLSEQGGSLVPHTQTFAAVTHYQYGAGRALFIGFDLLAQATALGGSNSLQGLLLDSLQFVMPAPVSPQATAVLPIRLDLHNLGIATPGEVQVSLTGATVEGVPAEATILDASQFSWPFDISLEQQLYWHFTVRLQILAANATVDASIYSGEAGDLVLQDSQTLHIAIQSSPSLATIATDLESLAAEKSAHKGYGKALTDVQAAISAQDSGDPTAALSALIAATDQLAPIAEVAAEEIRTAIDEQIRVLGTQL